MARKSSTVANGIIKCYMVRCPLILEDKVVSQNRGDRGRPVMRQCLIGAIVYKRGKASSCLSLRGRTNIEEGICGNFCVR